MPHKVNTCLLGVVVSAGLALLVFLPCAPAGQRHARPLQGGAEYAYVEVVGNTTSVAARKCPSEPAMHSPLKLLSNSARLISVTQFNNEEDLLFARFLEAFDVVDLFVVIEAPFTYTGKPKPLHFDQALCSKFGQFASKIVHVVDLKDVVADSGEDAPWHREFRSRLVFQLVAQEMDLKPDDMIFQSDTDELATAAALETARNLFANGLAAPMGKIPLVDLRMPAYAYSLSHKDNFKTMHNRAKMFRYDATRICSFQHIRSEFKDVNYCPQAEIVESLEDAGSHLTFFMPPSTAVHKLHSYAHQETNMYNEEALRQLIANNATPLGWTLDRRDPVSDWHIMRYSPQTRAFLLQFSRKLDAQL